MACIENECTSCGHTWHNNDSSEACPECGNEQTISRYDEEN